MGFWKNVLVEWEEFLWAAARKELRPKYVDNKYFKEAFAAEIDGAIMADYEDIPIIKNAAEIQKLKKAGVFPHECEFTPVFDLSNIKNICSMCGRVFLKGSYTVDLNDPEMVERAKSCLYEDILNAVKSDMLQEWIDSKYFDDAYYSDIPDFLKEDDG